MCTSLDQTNNLDLATIHHMLERVETEVQRFHAHLPEEIAIKPAAL